MEKRIKEFKEWKEREEERKKEEEKNKVKNAFFPQTRVLELGNF